MVHTVHTNRDKLGRREGRSVRDGGGRGEQDALGCALFDLNEENELSHTPPPILEIKKTENN